MMPVVHYRVVAPHFVCAVTVDYDGQVITDAAPILRWAVRRDWFWFRNYAARKAWQIQALRV